MIAPYEWDLREDEDRTMSTKLNIKPRSVEDQATNRAILLGAWRSRVYRQGRDGLRKQDDTFCCLGIACDLMVKSGLGQWSGGANAEGWYIYEQRGLQKTSYPLSGDMSILFGIDFGGELAELNDHGVSFEDIAVYTECRIADPNYRG